MTGVGHIILLIRARVEKSNDWSELLLKSVNHQEWEPHLLERPSIVPP